MLRSPPLSGPSSDALPALREAQGFAGAPRDDDALRGCAAVSATSRCPWVDVAKGLGIVLVVIGHALVGLLDAGLLPEKGAGDQAHYLIYTFHMPLFFFLAGLFVTPRLERDAGAFARAAFTRLAWPYLLWSTLQSLVVASLGGMVNHSNGFDIPRFVALLWEPAAQFWFLQSLFVMQLLAWWGVPRIGAGTLAGACIALRVLPDVMALPVVLMQVLRFAPFFMLGVWLGPWLLRRVGEVRRHAAWTAAVALAAACAGLTATARAAGAGYWSLIALPAALCGAAAAMSLAVALQGWPARLFARLGQASMAIFVLHVMFVAGLRIVLHKLLGVHSADVILPVAVLAGLAGPLLVLAAASRGRVARALGLQ